MFRHLAPTLLVVTTIACAPFGEGILGGGSTSSFSSVGSAVPVPGGADVQAQELLLRALGDAVQASSVGGGTFATVDPAALTSIDPRIRAARDVQARVGVVSIDLASDRGLVLSTKSKSGRSFCLSMRSMSGFAPPNGGTVDAHGATRVEDCRGTNWMFGP